MKVTEQYFPLILFIMLYKVALTFESVDKILKCDHSNESYWAVLSRGTVYYAVHGGSNVWVCGSKPKVWQFKWKLPVSIFVLYCSAFSFIFSNSQNFTTPILALVPLLNIYEIQLDNTGDWPLLNVLKGDSSPAATLLLELWFTQEVSCIGFEQRNASFLTSIGFSLENESWFGVLSLSWVESVDSFVSVSVSTSLSGVSSRGIFLAGSPWVASSKYATITLVLSALKSLSRHLDNARWINLLEIKQVIRIVTIIRPPHYRAGGRGFEILWSVIGHEKTHATFSTNQK